MNIDRSLLRFLLSSFWPLIAFVLFLSIGLNAFFLLVDRFRNVDSPAPLAVSSIPLPTDDSFARGPEAFGLVTRGFERHAQGTTDQHISPVKQYVISPSSLPTLPPTMSLFRDPGFEVDRPLIDRVFAGLRAPPLPPSLPLFTRSITLRSVDFSTNITLDAERRILTVSLSPSTISAASAVPADDVEVTAIARDFAKTLGVDLATLPSPIVRDVRDAQGDTKTMVIWYASFNNFPLLDTQMQPVERLSVQVGRFSHRAIVARINLLQPGSISRSDYPTATVQSLTQTLASGGLLPVARDLKGTPSTAEFSSIDIVYALISSDREYPLYVVPVVRARWTSKPSCKGCEPLTLSTFVPALDPTRFQWVRSAALPAPSMTSSFFSSSVNGVPPSSHATTSSLLSSSTASMSSSLSKK